MKNTGTFALRQGAPCDHQFLSLDQRLSVEYHHKTVRVENLPWSVIQEPAVPPGVSSLAPPPCLQCQITSRHRWAQRTRHKSLSVVLLCWDAWGWGGEGTTMSSSLLKLSSSRVISVRHSMAFVLAARAPLRLATLALLSLILTGFAGSSTEMSSSVEAVLVVLLCWAGWGHWGNGLPMFSSSLPFSVREDTAFLSAGWTLPLQPRVFFPLVVLLLVHYESGWAPV